MTLPILILLISIPGIQLTSIDDEVIKQFTVSEILDDTTADCSLTPGSGGPMDRILKFDLIGPPMPENTGIIHGPSSMLTLHENHLLVTPSMIPVRPNPEPEPPAKVPDAITPEPPVVLVVMAVALLSLFFFRRRTATRHSR